MKILVLLIFSFHLLYSNSTYIDTITFSKIKKLVEKEEEIAKAYKDYIVNKGARPSSLNLLISNNYLHEGFDNKNLFNREIKLLSSKNQIENVLPNTVKYKSNIYDYYYSNKNRKYSKAPLSQKINNISIVLDSREKYIVKYESLITTDKSLARNKFYLEKGVLSWYDIAGVYKFSLTKDFDLILDNSLGIPGSDTFNALFIDLLKTVLNIDVLQSGQRTYALNSENVGEYLNLGIDIGFIKIGENEREIGSTIIQFTRRAGGMIVNGDIYTWGNNANRSVGLNKNSYYNQSGVYQDNTNYRYPVINTLVRQRAKIYDNTLIDDKDYFSSPKRPKFVDFFSTVFHSTCGVSTKGELYCNGTTGVDIGFGDNFTHLSSVDSNREIMYRSRYFDGSTSSRKAKKIFANNQLWHILGDDGNIYVWGYDAFGSGFAGNGEMYYNYYTCEWWGCYYGINNSNRDPYVVSTDTILGVKFQDITYLLTLGHRKIGALSTSGDVYIWGMEDYNSDYACSATWEGKYINLCKATKVETTKTFKSLKGGLQAFVALGDDSKYYKIQHLYGKQPEVISIDEKIRGYTSALNGDDNNKFVAVDDNQILSVDISSRYDGSTLVENDGIVWVNGKNQLKGYYFTGQNQYDKFFVESIKRIKWKTIKVIEDNNGMCGIDIYNQMYCWGVVSYFRDNYSIANTFMLPVFNTNLYDLDKDFMVAEGGSGVLLTSMTSGEWKTTAKDGGSGTIRDGAFFLKYPTYIGGFNYEFEFK